MSGVEIDWASLEQRAQAVRLRAHAPYSNYQVGAAILCKSGNVYEGCNVENASYGLCMCAERSAISAMVAAGDRDPVAIAIATKGPRAGSPCGMCRQVLAEFALDLPVHLIVAGQPTETRKTTLAILLPDAFRSDSLS